jgi:hypothetical protein
VPDRPPRGLSIVTVVCASYVAQASLCIDYRTISFLLGSLTDGPFAINFSQSEKDVMGLFNDRLQANLGVDRVFANVFGDSHARE